jgi:hypothetical protein
MANNSTDINKTNNYLSHQLVEQMKNEAYDVRNRGHGFGQVHKYGGLSRVMRFQSPLDDYIFNCSTYVIRLFQKICIYLAAY